MGDPGPQAVLLDTNVFVSAIRRPLRLTDTFRLLVRLLAPKEFWLVGNEVLAREYLRYARVFPSPTASALAVRLLEATELVPVEERFLRACAPHFPPDAAADCVHAATCLRTGAILVSNDKHFQAIRRAGLVPVLTATEAIRRWVR